MSNPLSSIMVYLALAGLLGVGTLLGARVVFPRVHKTASPDDEDPALLTPAAVEEIDRWANEGGCCTSSSAST